MSSPKNDFFQKRVKNLKCLGYLLQLAPFVRAVILTGSMTTGSATKTSDIDLLIISQPGRLYAARFFVTILALLTGKKRAVFDKNPAGKFCLNYYLALDNLDILPHTRRCANFHRYIVNIWDRGGIYERILRQNFWLKRFPVAIKSASDVRLLKETFPLKKSTVLSTIQKIKELFFSRRFGDFVEKKLFIRQKKKITNSEIYKNNKSSIIVSKNELRLHPKKI